MLSCTSTDKNEKDLPAQKEVTKDFIEKGVVQKEQNGVPFKEEARNILQEWFDEFKRSVGGYSNQAESLDVLSVSGI